jgi:Kef-type K+ transport system membrane component KefB
LGPSVFGRIPGFTNTIFPPQSIEPFKLVANIGLVLYMFLVGLELDPRSFFANMKKTAFVSLAGMAVPFGLGVAVSWGLYQQLMDEKKVPFSSFLLFAGVAMSITVSPTYPVCVRLVMHSTVDAV